MVRNEKTESERLIWSLEQTRKALWQSRKETVELAEAGKCLGARRVGARRVWKIPKISVEEYIENDLRSAQERIV